MKLKDGKKMEGTMVIDVSDFGYFDELEYEIWSLFQDYAEALGFTLEEDEEPDWATVKEIHETILKQFKDAGVLFDYEGEKKRLFDGICDMDLSKEDRDYIMEKLWYEVEDVNWDKVKVTPKPVKSLPDADLLEMCGVFFYAKLPSKRGLMFYDFLSEKKVKYSNPDFESECKKWKTPVKDGHLIVEKLTDPDYPGFAISFESKNGELIDLSCVEAPEEKDMINIYTYADPWTEDYTSKDGISYEEIQKAIDSLA